MWRLAGSFGIVWLVLRSVLLISSFLHSDGPPRISELFIAGVRINELNKLLARLPCSLIFHVNDS
jgi:hypothetical protein